MLLVLYAALVTEASHETGIGRGLAGGRPRLPAGGHRWRLRVEEDGQLTAMLADADPPLTVSGESLASLRKQIRDVTLRGFL